MSWAKSSAVASDRSFVARAGHTNTSPTPSSVVEVAGNVSRRAIEAMGSIAEELLAAPEVGGAVGQPAEGVVELVGGGGLESQVVTRKSGLEDLLTGLASGVGQRRIVSQR